MFSWSFVLARRTARVISSAPAYSTAAWISFREYFPEPKMKREENSCPPKISLSFCVIRNVLSVLCQGSLSPAMSRRIILASWAAQTSTREATKPSPTEESDVPSPQR